MPKPSKPIQVHRFQGIEIKTQIWFNAMAGDEPKLTVAVGRFSFCDTHLIGDGQWHFRQEVLRPGEAYEDKDFAAALSARSIATRFLGSVAIPVCDSG